MKRPSILFASLIALIGAPLVLGTNATPAAAQDQEWSGGSGDESVRDLLRDWVRDNPERRDMLIDFLRERREARADRMEHRADRMARRERIRDRLSSIDDDEDDDGGLRRRLRERIAERRGGDDCFILSRSMRAADGDFMIIVRRRVCRD